MTNTHLDTCPSEDPEPVKEAGHPEASGETVNASSPPFTDDILELATGMSAVSAGVTQLQADFDTKIKYDQSKDRVIDALHSELQDLRDDLVFKIMRPLANDLVRLYDDIDQVTRQVTRRATENQAEGEDGQNSKQGARQFLDDIHDILDRYGFELFQTEDESFDRQSQKVTRAESTDRAALDMKIAQRVRCGLRYGERILRPENVVVYRFQKDAPGDAT